MEKYQTGSFSELLADYPTDTPRNPYNFDMGHLDMLLKECTSQEEIREAMRTNTYNVFCVYSGRRDAHLWPNFIEIMKKFKDEPISFFRIDADRVPKDVANFFTCNADTMASFQIIENGCGAGRHLMDSEYLDITFGDFAKYIRESK